jgi:hypothetical protein
MYLYTNNQQLIKTVFWDVMSCITDLSQKHIASSFRVEKSATLERSTYRDRMKRHTSTDEPIGGGGTTKRQVQTKHRRWEQ